MPRVTIWHPATERTADVPAESVETHRQHGWLTTEDLAATASNDLETSGEEPGSITPGSDPAPAPTQDNEVTDNG